MGFEGVTIGLDGTGGRSMLDLIEFRLLLLKKLGGDFIENPENVRPPFVDFILFVLLCPPPGVPSCGAVFGRCTESCRSRGILGAGADMPADKDCRCALLRWMSSNTFGPLPATGYEPFTGGAEAEMES